jgi:YihY family inner membrane protein
MATQTRQAAPGKRGNATSGLLQNVEKDVKPFQAFLTKFGNDWSMTLAAALAYNLLTAIFPIVVALLAIAGFILAELDPGAKSRLIDAIVGVFSSSIQSHDAQKALVDTITTQLAKVAGWLGIIALGLAIFGGSRLFILIESCFDLIYRVRPRTVIRQNIMAIGMLLLFIVLVPIMMFASTGPAIVLSILKKTPLGAIPGIEIIFSLGGPLGSLLVAFVLFEAIYIVVPNQRISFRNSWRGAVFAAIAMQIYLTLFPLYASQSLGNYAGAVGFAVILLAFFYYFAVILLLGAEVNAFFAEGVRPLPNDLVTFVSTMAGRLNRDLPSAESPSHQSAKPTVSADNAHIAATLAQEREIREKNAKKQRLVAAAKPSDDKAAQKATRRPSKLPTVFEVIAGSALAFIIELLRLRQKHHT